ncbi:Uncharacterized protein Adt_27088 [Abeliophyllum distichum]|uniref:Uncharacterized protein n=1 Tax=Abeliophyllum distichum TaxID=126358 RepID=A0ABD1RSQ5_9LAMI
MTLTNLSQSRIDGVSNSGSDSSNDTLPINAETWDLSDEGPVELRSCSQMDISCCHSGEKQKGSACRSKEKAKKIESVDLSYSVEHLASKVPKGSALYNFTLTFLVNCKNMEGFAVAKEPKYKFGWIQYNCKAKL